MPFFAPARRLLLAAFLLYAAPLLADPPFTITGIGDESLLEGSFYTSPTPVPEGDVSGEVTYSLLYQVDPLTVGDIPLFAGKGLLEIAALFLMDDSRLFTLSSATGVVGLDPQDFENPQDANSDNTYSITLVATDSAGNRNAIQWQVTIQDLPPAVFTLNGIHSAVVTEGRRYSGNAPNISGDSIGAITYSLFGNDSALFSVDPTTGLVAMDAMDYENPLDSDLDNVYEVTLVGTDNDNNSAAISWTVTITNLPALSFTMAPVVASSDENELLNTPKPAIKGRFRSPLHFTLTGDDAALFTLNSNGSVTLQPQDFEMPADADADNIYQATLTAVDNDDNSATTTITVTILDVEKEDGTDPDPLADRDRDGVPNETELAEGTNPDNQLSFKDSDHDGMPDALDEDADNDGLENADDNLGHSPYTDHDDDRIPDYLDADDRGDGTPAACNDFDGDRICTNGIGLDPFFDSDQDGTPNHADFDSDNDFLPDVVEGNTDVDSDLLPNYIDPDSDGDGLTDLFEGRTHSLDGNHNGIADYFDVAVTRGTDLNLDGIDDAVLPPDQDLDSFADYLDSDSDNDNIPDAIEGIPAIDSDVDALDDYLDSDSDNDGVPDAVEAAFVNPLTDSDGDGLADFRDLDSDNDSLPDVDEAGGRDDNSDALQDSRLPVALPLPDRDNDGTPDYRDIDSNNDGVFDIVGSFFAPFDTNHDGRVDPTTDGDLDGIDNSIDTAPMQFGLLSMDSDFDGIFDRLDADDDNDNISDLVEGFVDSDNDGVADRFDRDSDNDGISDLLESGAPSRIGDSNLNGVDDSVDVAFTGGSDANLDGMDDRFAPQDFDEDGTPDFRDSDSENDQLSDNTETTSQLPSGSDSDHDGIDNLFDVNNSGGSDANGDGVDDAVVALLDTDGDGLFNHHDPDSDNDGFSDHIENDDTNHDGIPDRLQPEGEIKPSSGGGAASPLLLLLLAALLAVPFPSRAAEKVCGEYPMRPSSETDFSRCFYTGLGIGLSTLEPDTESSSWEAEESSSPAFQLYGGYHFARDWFAELAYTNLGTVTLASKHVLLTQKEEISYQATSLVVGYYLPIGKWFLRDAPLRLFAKAGVSQLSSTASGSLVRLENDRFTPATLGGGIEWEFHKRWMLRGDLSTYSAEAHYAGLSIAYWMGGKEPLSKQPAPPPAKVAVPVAESVMIPDRSLFHSEAAAEVAAESTTEPAMVPVPQLSPVVTIPPPKLKVYTGYIPSIYGAFNSTDLTYPSFNALDSVIMVMNDHPDTRIRITAHTDNRGSKAVNMKLSKQRAQVVKEYLMQNGIRADRIETRGLGAEQPIAENDSAEGRSMNRRVDFEIINKP